MTAQKMTPLTPLPQPPNRRTDTPAVFSEKVQATVDAEKVMVDQFNTNVIPTFNATVDPINQVLANLAEINTVAGIISAVSRVATSADKIDRVHTSVTNVDRVAQSADKVDRVHTSIAKVDRVHTSIANVDNVNAHIANVDTIATHITHVDTVATHIDNVDTVTAHIVNVDTVATDIANVNRVAGVALAVASIVADKPAIDSVYSALPIVEEVYDNLTRIVAVDNAGDAIKLAGLHINTIDAVGGNIGDVQAVAAGLDDIASVKADMAHIQTVADHAANVDAVGRNIAAVQEVDRRMQLVINAEANAATAATAATEAARQARLAKQHAEAASAVSNLPAATDQNDQQPVIWNKDLGGFSFGVPGGANLLPAPAITLAANLPIGFAVPYTLTGLPGLVGTTISKFQLQINAEEIQNVTATDTAYSGTITAQGNAGAVWAIKARAVDSKGNISLWTQTTAVLVAPAVNTPNVTSPLAGAIVSNKMINLTGGPFGTTHLADTHKASRWVISTDAAGNKVLHDSGWRQDAKNSYTAVIAPVAGVNAAIYAHVWYEGALIGQSAKSAAVALKTSYVLRPSITSPLLSTMVGTDRIEMTCSDFVTYAGSFDTHVATRWRVTTDAAGNNALSDSGWTSTSLTEHTAALSPLADPASALYLWVEQRGVLLGDSAKSTSVRVVTGSLQTPTITSPAAGATILPTGFSITSSAFAPVSGAADTMKALYVQAATDELFTNKIYDSGRILTSSTSHTLAFSAQPQGGPVFTRVRYEGGTLGISGWSAPVRLVVTKAQTPRIISPANGTTGVPIRPTFTLSPWSDTGKLDTGSKTRVQVSKSENFASLAWDSGEVPYTTSLQVGTDLEFGTQYYARPMHRGVNLGETGYGGGVGLKTQQWNGMMLMGKGTAPNDNESIETLATLPDGRVLLGGWVREATPTQKTYSLLGIATISSDSITRNCTKLFKGAGNATTSIYTIVLLQNGRIVFGGGDSYSGMLGIATISGDSIAINSAKCSPLYSETAIRTLAILPDGRVVFGGGIKKDPMLGIATISGNSITVNSAKWLKIADNSYGVIQSIGVLPDGRVVFGGSGGTLGCAVLGIATISGNSITINSAKHLYGGGNEAFVIDTLALLPDGCVVFGGRQFKDPMLGIATISGNSITINTVKKYKGLSYESFSNIVALPGGHILFGGGSENCLLGTAAISGSMINLSNLLSWGGSASESLHCLSLLPDGRVAFGGNTRSTPVVGGPDGLFGAITTAPYDVTFPAPIGWKCQTLSPLIIDFSPVITDWVPTLVDGPVFVDDWNPTATDWAPTINVYPF